MISVKPHCHGATQHIDINRSSATDDSKCTTNTTQTAPCRCARTRRGQGPYTVHLLRPQRAGCAMPAPTSLCAMRHATAGDCAQRPRRQLHHVPAMHRVAPQPRHGNGSVSRATARPEFLSHTYCYTHGVLPGRVLAPCRHCISDVACAVVSPNHAVALAASRVLIL